MRLIAPRVLVFAVLVALNASAQQTPAPAESSLTVPRMLSLFEAEQLLVQRNVAVTSTLAVFDAMAPHRPPFDQRMLDVLTPQGALTYMAARARASDSPNTSALEQLKQEQQFEYDFVKAGGLLMAGVDPTGNGGAMAGFGDLRNLELLVEAEFTPAPFKGLESRSE